MGWEVINMLTDRQNKLLNRMIDLSENNSEITKKEVISIEVLNLLSLEKNFKME